MRIIRLTTDKGTEAIEREILNSLQFFFGWHVGNVSFEIDTKSRRGEETILAMKYTINTPTGSKTGRLIRLSVFQPSKSKFVIVSPDEPVVALALSHGLSQIAENIDVNIGTYNHVNDTVVENGKIIEASPVTVNTAINSAITSLLVDKKLIPGVFPVPLSYGVYTVVYGLKKAEKPLDMFEVELELVFDGDVVEIGYDAGGHSKHVRKLVEEVIKVDEEFVYLGDTFEVERRLEERDKRKAKP